MTPSKHLKTPGLMPSERYVTTYNSDYKPLSERHRRVNERNRRTESKAAPAFISPPQTHRETWPVFQITTNSIYGSRSWQQPPYCSLLPSSLLPLGLLPPPISEASRVVSSSLTDARTQKVGTARETWPLFCEEEKGQLHYVLGGKGNMLEQQKVKDEPKKKIDVLYEEGVIVLSSHVVPACCKDCIRCVCREAGLQHLLPCPVASSPVITIKDAENWDSSACLRGFGLKNSTYLQPASRQCSCCAWKAECPNGCCYKMRGLEYQTIYTAEWAQPKTQQSDIHHLYPPCHQLSFILNLNFFLNTQQMNKKKLSMFVSNRMNCF